MVAIKRVAIPESSRITAKKYQKAKSNKTVAKIYMWQKAIKAKFS